VETAFNCYAHGGGEVPAPMHIRAEDGGFHAKGARLKLDRDYVAVKVNGNFPGNPKRGLPTIQGVIVLCDGTDGSLLAVMDSIEVTLRRTAAATALAARFLAPRHVRCIAVCGCGDQGRAQLAALAEVAPVGRALAWDRDAERAASFAREMSEALGWEVAAVSRAAEAAGSSQIIVTATTARAPFLTRDMVPRGAFVAAVGADSPDKNELSPDLMADATIVVDLLAQAATMGDLHHAIDAGVLSPEDVHAELGDLVAERKPGRCSDDETIVFDSTGTALQDVASAARIWERAIAAKAGTSFKFGAL
jgi:ornithine cyclodeaminase/alanine dehydrogenase-like protein (mu-crystallin family)